MLYRKLYFFVLAAYFLLPAFSALAEQSRP